MPTAADFGYNVDAGVMHRILMAPRGIPKDRLDKLRTAMKEMQSDKTYKKMMAQLGENTDFINGPQYEKMRKEQSVAYAKLIHQMARE